MIFKMNERDTEVEYQGLVGFTKAEYPPLWFYIFITSPIWILQLAILISIINN